MPGLSTSSRRRRERPYGWHFEPVALRHLGLWPRLAVALTAGFLVLFSVFSVLSIYAVDDSTARILQERLVVTEMAARMLDSLLERGFHELERTASFAAFDPLQPVLADEAHLLSHVYSQVEMVSLGVYFLDARGRVVQGEPTEPALQGRDVLDAGSLQRALATGERTVSAPLTDPRTGRPAVALVVPLRDEQGRVRALLTNLLDLASPGLTLPLERARHLGHTGHAELVDRQAMIVAATDPGCHGRPGEHREFYLRLLAARQNGVETVPYQPCHEPAHALPERHVMAFAPLAAAPWGLAVGGTEADTFAPVDRLRRNILLLGALSLGMVWLAALAGARLLVQPVNVLTAAARRMAAGDLAHPIAIRAGGEIQVLAEAVEAMRVRLRASLDEIAHWNSELERKVQERTAALEERNRQLAAAAEENTRLARAVSRMEAQRELDRLRAEFVSTVSHELRSPLGVIKGYVTTLLRDDITPDAATQHEFLDIVSEETDKLLGLIEQLLDASQLRAGALELTLRPTALAEVVARSVARAGAAAGARFALQVETPLPLVLADAQRIDQVLQNLLENAAKYSPPGRPIAVVAASSEAGDTVVVRVIDQGDGIPQDERDTIFQPFARGTNALRRRAPGTGLGLAICKGIVETHGGRIWAESAPGRGSMFVFTLPALREAVPGEAVLAAALARGPEV
ncbi:MAG: HAMP domain-containing protein [Chloroflexi bacterium]|nr:HAMP domain-containing protein [Chloroflexota bacterium]